MEAILIISILVIVFGYGGYTIPLMMKQNGNNKMVASNNAWIPINKITIIIAAYNEETIIKKKIENTIALDYPKELIKIVVVTDGSTDNTYTIASQFKEVNCYHENVRKGKMAAIDRIMPFVESEITVFTDANTLLSIDSLRHLNRHFADKKVGGVAGEKKVITTSIDQNKTTNQEGLYWKYESWLKQIDSNYYSVVGAAGELYAIRTSLYSYPGDNIILDDFMVSMNICRKGYVFKYEPKAFATELPSKDLKEEAKRKIRIGAGGIQSIVHLKSLFRIWKNPKLSYLFISHRVLRWTIIPFLLPFVLIVNAYLILTSTSLIFLLMLWAQFIFYAFGFIGYSLQNLGKNSSITAIPYYIVFMNISQIKGVFKYLKGAQSGIWEKAKRMEE
jgi:cellulose synthase/poly-beta-1,6-N-acetylglucosamine synthase-like glycosyltransferase